MGVSHPVSVCPCSPSEQASPAPLGTGVAFRLPLYNSLGEANVIKSVRQITEAPGASIIASATWATQVAAISTWGSVPLTVPGVLAALDLDRAQKKMCRSPRMLDGRRRDRSRGSLRSGPGCTPRQGKGRARRRGGAEKLYSSRGCAREPPGSRPQSRCHIKVTGLAWEHRKRLAIKEIVAGATFPRAATFVAARARMVKLTAGSAIGLLVGDKGQLLIRALMSTY
jgi:hypothetical protein